MNVPLEWLQQFVDISTVNPHELAEKLTMRGFEVETVTDYRPSFDGIVAGRITKIDTHPNAQALSVCMVDTGKETLQIVCGAKNIREGDYVPVAVPGSRLSQDITIESKSLRGVESAGMLCSERELGLSEDHSGIFILPDGAQEGALLNDMPGIIDTIFDISIPPNRGDCLSILGIAREVASILQKNVVLPEADILPCTAAGSGSEYAGDEDISNYLSLSIKATDACPRYVLRMIRGTSIVQSPFWMRHRIIKCGMRPISSIVDVTNYVMFELGQPLHAFDYHRLRDKKIEVRVAEKPLSFRTLDGIDRNMEPLDLLICDGHGPVAIAGIMGGENSEITDETVDVALESAFFNPFYIRRTARRLGLKSEASLRFEKGIDIEGTDFAAKRAIALMQGISGGQTINGQCEIYEKPEKRQIYISFNRVNDIIGIQIDKQKIIDITKSLSIETVTHDDHGLTLAVPLFRHDILEYIDIIEEIARTYGYEHVPATTPVCTLQTGKEERKDIFINNVKEYFRSTGFYESINFAFFSNSDIENFFIQAADGRSSSVNIINPISKEFAVMRTFIAAGVLKNIGYNINRGAKNLRLFEIGKTFIVTDDKLPSEQVSLCFGLTGKTVDYFWREKIADYDFFDIKGILDGLMEKFRIDYTVAKTDEPFLNPDTGADVFVEGTKIGWIGEIAKKVLDRYEIEQNVYCAELKFDIIYSKGGFELKFKPISRYPQVIRDFTFMLDKKVPVSTLIQRIKKVSPLITSVGVFDMFRKDTTSVSLRVIFQSSEDTLKDEEVNSLQEIIINEIVHIDGVMLRT